MFQASLSVLLVLFVYVYKRDAQEQQDKLSGGPSSSELSLEDEYALLQIQQPHLYSSREPATLAKQSFFDYFYQKHSASVHIITFLLLTSFFFLLLAQAYTNQLSTALSAMGLLLLASSYLTTASLLWFYHDRTLHNYQSLQALRRQLGTVFEKAPRDFPKRSQTLLQLLAFLVYSTLFWLFGVPYFGLVWGLVLTVLLSFIPILSWFLWGGRQGLVSRDASSIGTESETEPMDEETCEMV